MDSDILNYLPDGYSIVGLFDVPPMGKPRETRRDKWNPSKAVAAYRAQRDRIKIRLRELGLATYDDPENFPQAGLHLLAFIAPPKSWTNKDKRAAYFTGCDSLPDADNILKGYLDAVFYKLKKAEDDGSLTAIDDRRIYDARVTKIWTPKRFESLLLLQRNDDFISNLRPYFDKFDTP